MQNIPKQERQESLYLRCHKTFQILYDYLSKNLLQEKTYKNTKVTLMEISVRIAGLTQDIVQVQSYQSYHILWLAGLLSMSLDLSIQNRQDVKNKIKEFMKHLLEYQRERILKILQVISFPQSKQKYGQKMKNYLQTIDDKVDIFAAVLIIYKLYIISKIESQNNKNQQYVKGIKAYLATVIYKVVLKHSNTSKYLLDDIKKQFQQFQQNLGFSEMKKRVKVFYQNY